MMRIRSIAHKEFLHIVRDPRSLALAILMPLMMVLLYGYAIDMDIKRLKVGILDLDHSSESADFVRRMTSGQFIVDAGRLSSRAEVEPAFRRDRFRAVLVFPAGYGRDLAARSVSPVQILVDGADGATAAAADNYLRAVVVRLSRETAEERLGSVPTPVEPRSRVFFNPELKSANFIVPGLVAIILIMICTLLTSIAIVREKESGTLEQILTTPVRPIQVIIGKILPYMLVAMLDAAIVVLIGLFVFHVPMEGSYFVLAAYSTLYLFIALGLGLLISAMTQTQQVAMMMALVITLLPTLMLSGFIFPISSMPLPLQIISRIIPATYFLPVIRGVMLKGQVWFPLEGGVMLAMAILLPALAVKKFHARLD
jgi:ABC-2 type transport system permease protein